MPCICKLQTCPADLYRPYEDCSASYVCRKIACTNLHGQILLLLSFPKQWFVQIHIQAIWQWNQLTEGASSTMTLVCHFRDLLSEERVKSVEVPLCCYFEILEESQI